MKNRSKLNAVLLGILILLMVWVVSIFIRTKETDNFINNDSKKAPPSVVKVNETPKPSITLPTKYVGAQQDWPPLIKNSPVAYSCVSNSGSGDVPKTIVQKKINNRIYCITSMIDAGAGSRFGEYTYITANGTGSKTTAFSLRWSSCGGYGGPGDAEYDECQAVVSSFLNNLDMTIDSFM